MTGAIFAAAMTIAGIALLVRWENHNAHTRDGLLLLELGRMVSTIECAHDVNGAAPVSAASLLDVADQLEPAKCDSGWYLEPLPSARLRRLLSGPAQVDYRRLDETHAEVCANFERSSEGLQPVELGGCRFKAPPDVAAKRAMAGRFCFRIGLSRAQPLEADAPEESDSFAMSDAWATCH